MRVVYVASNPPDGDSLLVEKEVTRIQRSFLRAAGEPVHFIALPNLSIEHFPTEIATHKPDILHISAHGQDGLISFVNEAGNQVAVSAAMLKAFLDYDRPPQLVYLNSCDSISLAREVVAVVPMVIGTTAPITNRAAREAAALFYDRILDGLPVANAYAASSAMIGTLQNGAAASKLVCQPDVTPGRRNLYHAPRVLARFSTGGIKEKDSNYWFDFGVAGCPSDTVQVVFFTDDDAYITGKDELATELCDVERSIPVRGEIWLPRSWSSYSDMRLFACGATASGRSFSAGTTLCGALETFYKLTSDDPRAPVYPNNGMQAIEKLRSMNGAQLQRALHTRKEPNDKKKGARS